VTFEERIMLLAGARGLKPYFGTRRRAGNRFWLSYAVEGNPEAIAKFVRDLERELKQLGCVNLPCMEWYARGLPWIRPLDSPPKK
jgi:hypothetical protein